MPSGLKLLQQAVCTQIDSTAECERLFCAMSWVPSQVARNLLAVAGFSDILFTQLGNPAIWNFNPKYYLQMALLLLYGSNCMFSYGQML